MKRDISLLSKLLLNMVKKILAFFYKSIMFSFKPTFTSFERARFGVLETPHGCVDTPAFIFCATKASIKGVSMEEMKKAGTQIILSNTYHLTLQPGSELIELMGGLQKFTNWNGPMLTDSGGFQIFSLGHGSVATEIKGNRKPYQNKTLVKITEEGALFKSYLNGEKILLTPERSIQIQQQLGADLIVVLDECTPFHVDKSYTHASLHRSHRWAIRCLKELEKQEKQKQVLYGIIQGGVYLDLRQEGADFVNTQPFFGHAIGGSLGACKEQMREVVDMTTALLKKDRPIHLLGIGKVEDIFSGVEKGIDTFDCVHPTRLARHGGALVRPAHNPNPYKDHINLRNKIYKQDNNPIEQDCACTTCEGYTKSYLHHLLKAEELLALSLISIHNISFMNRLMKSIRIGLKEGTYPQIKKEWVY